MIFIGLSCVMALFLAVWGWREFQVDGRLLNGIISLAGGLAAVALVVYLTNFIRKARQW